MHPFYGPSFVLLQGDSSQWLGLMSMFLYLLFWAVVVFIAFRWLRRMIAGRELFRKDTALIILRERYARGEIARQEFLEKQADLNHEIWADRAGSKTRTMQEHNTQQLPGSEGPVRKTGGVR